MSITELRDLANIELSWEQRLDDAGESLGIKTVDRINHMRQTPDHLRHKGAAIQFPRTTARESRGKDLQRVEDDVTVELLWRVRPTDQKVDRRAGKVFEGRVRRLITDRGWESSLHIKFLTSSRSVHPMSSDWIVTVLTFSQTRYIRTE
jgi:hypothetical protein